MTSSSIVQRSNSTSSSSQKPIKVVVFSARPYDKTSLLAAQESRDAASQNSNNRPPRKVEFIFHDCNLTHKTASLAGDATAVSVFVNDTVDAAVLEKFQRQGVKAILLRCAGYNNVDLEAARRLGLFVANVPAYSPESVAEFSVALLLTLNRKTHLAYNRVRDGNFSLVGLTGMTLHNKVVGIIGTGKIGLAFARILHGFGCTLLAYDPFGCEEFTKYGQFVSLDTLLAQSDVVSLHCPLTSSTRHIINETTLGKMKNRAILINTSRGALIDTRAAVVALKQRRLGGLALDVYEGEESLFYRDHSGEIIEDDDFERLVTLPNVLISGHQAFLTEEALLEISQVTLGNLEDYLGGRACPNSLVKKS